MKFQPEKLEAESIIQGYDSQGVIINGQRYIHSLFFGADLQPTVWENALPGTLGVAHVEQLLDQSPRETEVFLIGTGQTQQFPTIEVRRFFVQKKVPVEFMDTQAACRTYNILIGEGRKVVAALLQEKP
jgi:uncharacterized protein